jgi:hypothetical protein
MPSLRRSKESLLDMFQAAMLLLILAIVGGISFMIFLIIFPIFLGIMILDCYIRKE